jgi:kynurenine 3-monooxygenase
MSANQPGASISLVGGGLVGSLLATGLARRGFEVELLERRSDPRTRAVYGGRSINLALSVRGVHALRQLGLDQRILSEAIPMRGRMMHAVDGSLTFQPYGVEDWQCIYSISRGELNKSLLSAAEETGKVRIRFEQKLVHVQAMGPGLELELHNEAEDKTSRIYRRRVIGTDGSASVLRSAIVNANRGRCSEKLLDYGYKELAIAPKEGATGDARFKMDKHALHIWPRGNFMLIALPNFDGSFTLTLFMPYEGPVSLEKLRTPADVREFFTTYFPDTLPLIENLEGSFFENPTGHMITVKTHPWNWDSRALLLGDAAHAIVPFFGQGMNCGFEDCSELFSRMDAMLHSLTTGLANTDADAAWCSLFNAVSETRWRNADAIADMAVENFIEMRDRVGDRQFLNEKALEKRLQVRFPREYISKYSLVSFSRVPYTIAVDAGAAQEKFLKSVCPPGVDPATLDIESMHERIREEIAPILIPFLPEGLKNGYAETGGQR